MNFEGILILSFIVFLAYMSYLRYNANKIINKYYNKREENE